MELAIIIILVIFIPSTLLAFIWMACAITEALKELETLKEEKYDYYNDLKDLYNFLDIEYQAAKLVKKKK